MQRILAELDVAARRKRAILMADGTVLDCGN